MTGQKSGGDLLSDMLDHGEHSFPADIEDMIHRLNYLNPEALTELGQEPVFWAEGERLDEGRAMLKALLRKHGDWHVKIDHT